ncbi:MAG: 4Fe-4S dicluster domain-containing protein [Bacillota bacterium]
MSVCIDRQRCTGCGKNREPLCVRICPGDLLVPDGKGKVRLRNHDDCWDCTSCIKACPRGALTLKLPLSLGGKGSGRLLARAYQDRTSWVLLTPRGEETFEIISRGSVLEKIIKV